MSVRADLFNPALIHFLLTLAISPRKKQKKKKNQKKKKKKKK